MTEIKLPAITKRTLPALESLTRALNVPRDILASDDEIEAAWVNMPRVLKKMAISGFLNYQKA